MLLISIVIFLLLLRSMSQTHHFTLPLISCRNWSLLGGWVFEGIDDLIWDFYKLKSTCLWGGLDLIWNFVISSHFILRKCLTWLGILWFQVISSCGSTWLDLRFCDFKSSHLAEMLDLICVFVIWSHPSFGEGLTWFEFL